MATTVADPPAPDLERQPGADGAPPASGPAGSEPAPAERKCANCGQSLAPGQEWCLQCGTAAPGALTARSPGWRSAAAILGATAILVLAAAAAAYAALTQPSTPGPVTQTVAQAPAAPPPATPAVPPATPPPVTPTTPPAGKALPVPTSKPPKIPLTATTPKTVATTPKKTASTTKPPAITPTKSTPSSEAKPQQPAILLDTNAASTYNPSHLPEASFGDPSLAIDGETTTGWTAVVEPATAPNMTVGLLIDLRDTQRLSAAEVITPTPGLTATVYGSAAAAAPPAITSTEWTALSKPEVIKKRHTRIDLAHSDTGFRFVVLWITKAPASAVGTPQAPGRVSINELELFAATK